MKSRSIRAVFGTIILLQSVYLAGCATGLRFYSGEPRPRNEVALFRTGGGCDCVSVQEAGQPQKAFYIYPSGELLPGYYILRCGYVNVSGTATSNGAVNVELNAQAGHLYFIHAEILDRGTWTPRVVDVSGDDDYSKVPAQYREGLRGWVRAYLQSGRRVVRQDSGGMWH
jgi:hypothetical protein